MKKIIKNLSFILIFSLNNILLEPSEISLKEKNNNFYQKNKAIINITVPIAGLVGLSYLIAKNCKPETLNLITSYLKISLLILKITKMIKKI